MEEVQKQWNFIERQKQQLEFTLFSKIGIKVLFCDSLTQNIVLKLMQPAEFLLNETYFIYNIDQFSDIKTEISKMVEIAYSDCVCFLTPNKNAIAFITKELEKPHFKDYYLYFSNELTEDQVDQIARADTYGCVKTIETFFMETLPITNNIFTLNQREYINEEEKVKHISQ